MDAQFRSGRALLLGCGVLASFAGCLLVTPLDDVPKPDASKAGAGGSGVSGNSSVLPDAGEAGAMTGGRDGSGPSGPCETNADCVAPGAEAPYRCRPSDHACVPLYSDACPLVFGDASDANALYFGAFATLNPIAPGKNSILWSHQLALGELSGDNIGGLPDGPDGARPLVMIACDNSASMVEAALQHLAEEVEVPALIATLKPGDLRRGFEAHRDRDIFYLSPVSMTDTVVSLKDAGLVWNFLGQPSDLTPSYAELLRLSETWLRNSPDVNDVEAIRVALVTTTDAFDAELANAVTEVLEFNGLDLDANTAEGDYQPFTIDTEDPQLEALTLDIVEFRPHIIVSAASDLFTMPGGLLSLLEMEWGNGEIPGSDMQRPFYMLSPYNAGDLGNVEKLILDLGGFDPSANERFLGLSIAGAQSPALQNSYGNRLRSLFPNANSDTANYYDAVYFLAYAMYGSSDTGQLTGPGIADGMQRLLSGESSFNVGPTPINKVFDALREPGSTIQLQSTLGPPSFDAMSGVRKVDGGVFCFEQESATSIVRQLDVLRYDRDLGAFAGAFPCFTGFFP